MLNSWKVINFKSIRKADLELGKINLIVGANSIGKSSLIQSIVGFAQFASQPSVETGVASLNGPSLNLGSARTITHHGGSNCAFEAEFSGKREGPFSQGKRTVALDLYNDFPNYDFTVKARSTFFQLTKRGLNLHIHQKHRVVVFTISHAAVDYELPIMHVRFDVDPETQRPVPREIEYQDWVNLVVEVEREFGAKTARERNNVLWRAGVRPGLHLIIEGVFLKEIAPEQNDELFGRLRSPKNPRWDELLEPPNRDYDLTKDVSEFLYAHAAYLAGEARWESMRSADSTIIRSELPIWSWLGRHFDGHFRNTYERDLASKILYLGPMRVVGVRDQKNYPSLSPLTPIGPAGEHLASLLLLKRRLTAKFPMPKKNEMQSVTIIQALNAWQKHLGIDSQVQAEGDKVVGARIRVGRYSLDNVGTGISQVAPVLTLALLAASEGGKTVVLEQPELHLHPSLQRKLADFFYEMSRHNCQFIIETHSEYLVTRLRLLRARADLNGDDLKILFAESKGSKKEGKRAEFRTISVGDKGYLSEWPEGFLDGVDIDQYAIASIQTLQ